MDKIDVIAKKVIASRGLTDEVNASLVTVHARKWIEEHVPPLLEYIEIKAFKDGQLIIESKHPIASQECHNISSDLLKALQEEYEHKDLEGIRIIRE